MYFSLDELKAIIDTNLQKENIFFSLWYRNSSNDAETLDFW